MGNPNHDPKTGEFSSGGGSGSGGKGKRLRVGHASPAFMNEMSKIIQKSGTPQERAADASYRTPSVPTTHVHHEPGSDAMKRQLAHQADEASIARTMAKEAAMGPRKPGERAPTLEEHRQMLQNYKNRHNLPPHRQ